MQAPDPAAVEDSRRRNMLLTMVMVGLALTPAWLTPPWFSIPWQIFVLLFGIPAVYYSWRYTPWLPTPVAETAHIVAALQLQPGQSFCDLGAGEGRFLLAVHAITGAAVTGLEISPFHYLLGRIRLALQGTAATKLLWADIYDTDLSTYDSLYVWGTAYLVSTPQFAKYLAGSLKPGARLVSCHHPLVGIEPDLIDETGQRPLFIYTAPLAEVNQPS